MLFLCRDEEDEKYTSQETVIWLEKLVVWCGNFSGGYSDRPNTFPNFERGVWVQSRDIPNRAFLFLQLPTLNI